VYARVFWVVPPLSLSVSVAPVLLKQLNAYARYTAPDASVVEAGTVPHTVAPLLTVQPLISSVPAVSLRISTDSTEQPVLVASLALPAALSVQVPAQESTERGFELLLVV
jgi:hypothetical protein